MKVIVTVVRDDGTERKLGMDDHLGTPQDVGAEKFLKGLEYLFRASENLIGYMFAGKEHLLSHHFPVPAVDMTDGQPQ